MANVVGYPAADTQAMAALAGYSVFEVLTFWTTELYQAKMSEYYAGTLTQVVDPTQKVEYEDWSTTQLFAQETAADVGALGEKMREFWESLPSLENVVSSLGLAGFGAIAIVAYLYFGKR